MGRKTHAPEKRETIWELNARLKLEAKEVLELAKKQEAEKQKK